MFDPNTNKIRAIKGISPVNVAVDTNHVEVWLDQSGLASIPALLAVKSIAESNNQAIADLMPQVEANNQALTSLTAQVASKQAQLSAGTGMVVHQPILQANKIKSLTAGANVTLASTDDFVTISAQTPPQVVAPFSVMGPNMMAVRSRFGDSKAEIFTELEVNDDVRVTGILRAAQLRSDGIVQVGPSPPAGATLAVAGTIRATGNISTSAALSADTLSPNTPGDITVTSDLTIDGVTRLDAFQARQASQVTCQDNLTVTGVLACQGGLVSSQTFAAQSIVCQTDITVLGNINGWSPFWVAGLVNSTGVALATKGRVGFTCTRVSTGRFRIDFATPHPDGDAYVVSAVAAVFHCWVGLLTSGSCEVYMASASNTLFDANFHFMVLR
jgi:hypothetical protein